MAYCLRVYSDPTFSTLLHWRGNCSIFSNPPPPPPPATIILYALHLHSIFWHLHCFYVSSPSCDCFLLELSSECMLHHASKFSPYPVKYPCIHLLHIVHPFFLPVHDRTLNWVSEFLQNVVHSHVPLTL